MKLNFSEQWRWMTVSSLAIVLTLVSCRSVVRTWPSTPCPVEFKKTMPLSQVFPIAPPSTQPTTDQGKSTPKIVSEAILEYFQAKEAVYDQDFAVAISHLKKAIELDSEYLDAHRLLMKLAMESNKFPLAQTQAEIVLTLSPTDPAAHYVLGNLLLKKQKPDEAMLHLYRAVTSWDAQGGSPKLERLLAGFKLGSTLTDQGYLTAALDVYQTLATKMQQMEGIVQDPQLKRAIDIYQPAMYLILGKLSFKLECYSNSVTYFEKAAKFETVKNQAVVGQIQCAMAMNATKKAKTLLDELAAERFDESLITLYQTLYPKIWAEKLVKQYLPEKNNITAGVTLASELLRNDQTSSAIDLLKKILVVEPANTQAVWLMVRARLTNNESETASQFLFQKIIDGEIIFPPATDNFDTRLAEPLEVSLIKLSVASDQVYVKNYLLALVLQIKDKPNQAKIYYNETLKQQKDFLPAYVALGRLYLQLRSWTEADRLMDQALKQNLKNGAIYFIQGQALAEMNKPVESLKALESANELTPDSDRMILALIEGYLWTKEPAKAAKQIKRLIGGQFAGATVLGRLIELMLDANNPEMAEIVLQQYHQRFGDDVYYQLLTARNDFLKNRDVSAYRKILIELFDDSSRGTLQAKWLAELEFDLKNYQTAARISSRALQQYPKMDADDYKRLLRVDALSNWKLLNYDRAEWAWRKLITDWPAEKMNPLALAKMLMDAQAFETAQPLIQKLLNAEKNPEQRFQLQVWLIATYVGRDQILDAINTLDRWQANATAEEKPKYLKLKIDALIQKQLYPEALALLEGLVTQKQGPLLEWQKMYVSVLSKMHRPARALNAVDQFQAEDKTGAESAYDELRIPLLLEVEKYDQAINLATNAVKAKDPRKHIAAVLTLIQCYQKAGRFAEARTLAEEEAVAFPGNSLITFTLRQQIARSMELAGEVDAAETYIKDRIAESDGELENKWQQWLISLYFSQKMTDKAIDLLEDILATNPTLAWASNSLGYSLAERGKDLNRAETLIRKALADEPGSASYLDSLAWVLYRQQKFDQAYHYAKMAQRGLGEPDPVLLDHLGDICFKLGNIDEAKLHWRESIRACKGRDSSTLEPDMPDRTLQKLNKLK